MTNFNKKNGAGFTLVEMLVGIAIFSIITGIVVGIFISAVRLQRYALASQQLLDQTSYAIEYMSRFIRMAKKDDVDGTSCLSTEKANYEITRSGQGIKFKNYKSTPTSLQCQEFYLENGQLYEKINTENSVPLTSDDFDIKKFGISVSGSSQLDDLQPRVTIFLEAEAKGMVPRPKIRIQTMVSQRHLDIEE